MCYLDNVSSHYAEGREEARCAPPPKGGKTINAASGSTSREREGKSCNLTKERGWGGVALLFVELLFSGGRRFAQVH